MAIEYFHFANQHTVHGPRAVLPLLFKPQLPASLLDVGCGIGTWAKIAIDLGVPEVFGVDGVKMDQDQLLLPEKNFLHQDLTEDWDLGRHFEIVLCLEVAEHLDKRYAPLLVRNLVKHSDTIVFSAACPEQRGQHHVNCQWPQYWQALFNAEGFSCDDAIRWQIWDTNGIEPWYRQNMFIASRKKEAAGKEARLKSIVHPDMLPYLGKRTLRTTFATIKSGHIPAMWYLRLPGIRLFAQLSRQLKESSSNKSK